MRRCRSCMRRCSPLFKEWLHVVDHVRGGSMLANRPDGIVAGDDEVGRIRRLQSIMEPVHLLPRGGGIGRARQPVSRQLCRQVASRRVAHVRVASEGDRVEHHKLEDRMSTACVWHAYGMCTACVRHAYGMRMACAPRGSLRHRAPVRSCSRATVTSTASTCQSSRPARDDQEPSTSMNVCHALRTITFNQAALRQQSEHTRWLPRRGDVTCA